MVTIRNLEIRDAKQVALLIGQLTKNIVEPNNLEKRIEGLASQHNSHFVVAEANGVVFGFGGLVWYEIPSKGLIGWVEEVVVDQKNRGQGIGRDIMAHLLNSAKQKQINQIKLMTNSAGAETLYQSLGFVKKENHYLFLNI
jgi:N-acetylglutamate synthase-like GNAT family acetyltransferase